MKATGTKRRPEQFEIAMIDAAFARYFSELMVCQIEAGKIAEKTRAICDELVEWFNRNGLR